MTTEQITPAWTGSGLMWKDLALYDNGTHFIGTMKNSPSFMSDNEMFFDSTIGLDAMIDLMLSEDSKYYDEFTLSADEG